MGLGENVMRRLGLVLLATVSLGLAAPAAVKAAQTTQAAARAPLENIANSYVAALVKHQPAGLPVAATLKATENGMPTTFSRTRNSRGPEASLAAP